MKVSETFREFRVLIFVYRAITINNIKRKASRTKQQEDIANYKKQRNFVVKLNKETKLQYFNNSDTSKN